MMRVKRLFPNSKYSTSNEIMFQNLKPKWCNTYKWNSIINEMRRLNPNQVLNDEETIQSVYYHLVWLEDMIAIYEDRLYVIAESYIANIWRKCKNTKWKKLMANALTTQMYSIPEYFRPSLCLITPEWFIRNSIEFIPIVPLESITFTSVESPPLKFNENFNY